MIMEFLRDSCNHKIVELVDDRWRIEMTRKHYPVNTFYYELYTLAIAITDLKIEIYKAFIGEA